ncbi:MAG: histidine kinase dimerization/phospho-acceptor domain-containing protein [Gammaproteobacteria bacterium]
MNLPTGLLLCTADGAVLAGDDDSRRLLAAHGPVRGDDVQSAGEPVSWGDRRCLLVQASSSAGQARIERCAALAIVQRALFEGLVHDLRSPLNSIAMNAEMLRFSRDSTATNLEQRQDRYVAAITNESARLGGAVSTLVDLIEGSAITNGDNALEQLLAAIERFGVPALRTRQLDLRVEVPSGSATLARTDDLVLALLALVLGVAEHARPGATLVLAAAVSPAQRALALRLEGAGAGAATAAARLDASERATLLLVATRIVNAIDGHIELDAMDDLRVVLPAAA